MNFNFAKQSNNNNNKMSATNTSANTSAFVGQNQAKLTETTLDLYIPRASLKTTDFIVKNAFFQLNIGEVEYCDLVVIKDKETKEPLHMSVFLKLASWNPFTAARSDFHFEGSIKLHLANEFWIILPNKTPLPRTHVNTTQLAVSTEKLFEQTEQLTDKTTKLQQDQVEQMDEMRHTIRSQQDQIETLEFKLKMVEDEADVKYSVLMSLVDRLTRHMSVLNMDMYGSDTEDGIQKKLIESRDFLEKSWSDRIKQDMEPTPTRDFKMTLSELDPDQDDEQKEEEPISPLTLSALPALMLPPPPPLTRNNAAFYDYENDRLVEEEYQGEEKFVEIQRSPSYCEDMYVAIPRQFDQDDCIFSSPATLPASIPRLSRTVSVAPITLNMDRSRSSSPDDSVRASITRDICGNN